jgi:hypothetical protein
MVRGRRGEGSTSPLAVAGPSVVGRPWLACRFVADEGGGTGEDCPIRDESPGRLCRKPAALIRWMIEAAGQAGIGPVLRGRGGAQKLLDEITSRPDDVPSAHQVWMLMVLLMARTVPSPNRTLTTPGCRLPAV